jgi:NAD(P)-dependent dehydrogenase (short-subunit alcohol dehydrogenase family)
MLACPEKALIGSSSSERTLEKESSMEIRDHVAVVTGAGRGIGRGIALRFAREGAKVVLAGRTAGEGEAVAKEILAIGGEALYVRTDVTKPAEVTHLMEEAVRSFGTIDIMVNNAGVWFKEAFLEIPVEHWDQVIALNLRGTFLCSQSAAREMVKRGRGVILNLTSPAGYSVTRGQGIHYHTSKAGIIHFTTVLAYELAPLGIRVNALAPTGPGTAEVKEALRKADRARLQREIPMGRVAELEEIVEGALFLVSDRSSFVTGHTLVMSGGAVSLLNTWRD